MAVRAELTGPGGPFAVAREDVDGQDLLMYTTRMRSLREVAELARLYGDREFLVYQDRRITFAQFMAQVDSAAAWLRSAGIESGDRVAVLSANNPEWCVTFWATVSIGAVLVGLNGWWTADEVAYGLHDSGAKVLVVDGRRAERAQQVLAGGQAVRTDDGQPNPDTESASTGGQDTHRHVLTNIVLIDEDTSAPWSTPTCGFSELIAAASGPDVPPGLPEATIAERDPAVIFYTSGTTGRPKGAVSTHRSMIANLHNTVYLASEGAAVAARRGDAKGEPSTGTALLTSPLFHVAGCHSTLVVGFTAGTRLVVFDGKFDPARALQLIERERIAIWSAVPTMLWRTTEHPDRHTFDTSSVIRVAFGGSPSAAELQRRIRETFPNVRDTTNAYGLTESSSVATVLTGDDAIDRPDSVGLPLPIVELAIADPMGVQLPPGSVGEVLIRGPILMSEYWGKPEATANTIINGWLHTGDIGTIDEDGYLFITDRAKDMIIRGGENIYCVEVENRLVEHPGVADAAVIGIPDAELGETVEAVIERAPGSTVTDAELARWVGESLAAFKVPTTFRYWNGKIPRNASGKLLKNVLRGSGDVPFAETM